ncbi:MAG: hypothetical protein M3Y22_17210, partial [Pseudomonadota bacterium]|nr:hypothetical protein [Pseudomonadota bacterium]
MWNLSSTLAVAAGDVAAADRTVMGDWRGTPIDCRNACWRIPASSEFESTSLGVASTGAALDKLRGRDGNPVSAVGLRAS